MWIKVVANLGDSRWGHLSGDDAGRCERNMITITLSIMLLWNATTTTAPMTYLPNVIAFEDSTESTLLPTLLSDVLETRYPKA